MSEDSRYLRTERYLKRAFGLALERQPIEKVLVTNVVRDAEVSKAAFYLHYRDIYDLAGSYVVDLAQSDAGLMDFLQLYFSDPERFVARFFSFMAERQDRMDLLEDNGLLQRYSDALADAVAKRLGEYHYASSEQDGGAVVVYSLAGLIAIALKFAPESKGLAKALADLIATANRQAELAAKESLAAAIKQLDSDSLE